jgi:HSP20 family protein
MNLFKWTQNIKPSFPHIVEKFLGRKIHDEANGNEFVSTVPSVNIEEKNKAFEVSVAVPGLDKKDLKLEVQDHCLIISSERQYDREEIFSNWMRREYGYASFRRMFHLPEDANPDQIEASMKNGVLKIKVAKLVGVSSKIKSIMVH